MSMKLINDDVFMRDLADDLRKSLTEAAEPVIQKALQDAEADMRKRLGAHVVGYLQHAYSAERNGHELLIRVQLGAPKT